VDRFDVEKYVKENFMEVDRDGGEDDGLKIAGGRHALDEGIGIEIRTDKDEQTRKEEREREAEAKR
jgi:transcription initiation factor TFIIE subunit alpha